MIPCNEEVWLRHISVIKQYADAENKIASKRWGGPNAMAVSRADCIENGKKGGRPKHRCQASPKVALVIEMLNEGLKLRAIAKEVGISHQAVSDIKRRYL